MSLTPEMLNAAKNVKTVEEFIVLAKENGMEMTEESAAAYFEMIHNVGELSDDELNGVAGGWCYKGGRPVVTLLEVHDCYECGCGAIGIHNCPQSEGRTKLVCCGECRWCNYTDGLWLCDNPENRK